MDADGPGLADDSDADITVSSAVPPKWRRAGKSRRRDFEFLGAVADTISGADRQVLAMACAKRRNI
jgi:hypothetical protein